ncbi:MAG: type II toxin-antitoxin system VapC family toxin [Crenarchaeota archaeon]|nr:type II toxin-antitoxin system VapC family toxin [Thermoproteota archaeon]
MIVIDASALAKYILREEGWEEVRRFVHERRPLLSVDHVLKECLNALWKHTYIRRALDAATALEIAKRLQRLAETKVIILEDESLYLSKALEIALDKGVALYDALYVAQALRYGELLTCDEKQASAAMDMGVRVYLVR